MTDTATEVSPSHYQFTDATPEGPVRFSISWLAVIPDPCGCRGWCTRASEGDPCVIDIVSGNNLRKTLSLNRQFVPNRCHLPVRLRCSRWRERLQQAYHRRVFWL
jgi:hypothetical protein